MMLKRPFDNKIEKFTYNELCTKIKELTGSLNPEYLEEIERYYLSSIGSNELNEANPHYEVYEQNGIKVHIAIYAIPKINDDFEYIYSIK